MSAFLDGFGRRQRTPSATQTSIALQSMPVSAGEGPSPREIDEDADDDGALDADPLLPAHGRRLGGIRAEIERELAASGRRSEYERQSIIVNKAIQDIGMGRYQWHLFSLCGFGWLADNLWLQGLALVLPQLTPEFGISSTHVRYTTMITYIGLAFGATGWGFASDVIGRRPAFNMTLFLCGLFGTLIAFGPTWIITSLFFALMGTGVGGNLPVDGALFLEFLPFESNKLLTLLSVWWPIGQLIASILAWLLIPPFSCHPELEACSKTGGQEPCCISANNRGWRYYVASLGILTLLMFACRFFLFKLYESPKFFLSRRRQGDAVAIVQSIARYNKTETWLSEEILDEFSGGELEDDAPKLTVTELNRQRMQKFSLEKVRSLFRDRKLGMTTILLWFQWTCIGLAYPLFNAFLPQYFEHIGEGTAPVSTDVAYRNFLITSIVGLPGSIIAAYSVDIRYIGRKGTMAVSTLISGISLYLFTLSNDPGYQTLCSSVASFFQNIMYGVLYSYTPEVFPAPCRGTGTGIASLLNRISGITAPIIAAQIGDVHPTAPILAAGVSYLAAAISMVLLPIETRGKQSL